MPPPETPFCAGAAGNGNGGVTSKQHAVAAGLPSPSRSPLQRHPASPGSGLPPLPLSAAGAAAAAAAAAGEARVSGAPRASPSPWPSQAAACWPADQQQREQQQQRQERQLLLNQIRDEQQEEVERQRGAAEVADVCEALTSLRESGSPLNSCGGGAPGGGVPSPAGPSGGAKAAKAARLTRSTAAATGSRPHAARSTLESGIVAPAGARQGQAQQMGPAAGGPAQAQAQQQAAVAQALQFAPSLPQLFMQQAAAQAAAAAAMGRPSPATSPRQASAAATTQQQQQQGPTGAAAPQQPQQQQQMLPPPFLAGLTTQFGASSCLCVLIPLKALRLLDAAALQLFSCVAGCNRCCSSITALSSVCVLCRRRCASVLGCSRQLWMGWHAAPAFPAAAAVHAAGTGTGCCGGLWPCQRFSSAAGGGNRRG
jgi:hypothetical protein